MRVLVTPLMAMAESAGPASRARALASAMASIGWETTLCVPEGFTGMVPTGVSAQPILTPSPLGMPRIIGRKMFPLAQRLGLNRRVRINGIAYGSPQLICPGKVFERRFNAKAAERCGIGLSLEQSCFDVPTVRRTLEQLLEDAAGYHASAASLKNRLSELGGANRIVDTIARQAYGCPPNSTPPRAPRLYRLPDRKLRVSRCLSS